MADRGIMVELRIDTQRITELAPLYLETVLTGRENSAAIVAPASGPFLDHATDVQIRIEELTGTLLPIVDEQDVEHAQRGFEHLIAIGHIGNNRLLRRLHDLRCLTAEDYPKDGFRLLSLHAPFGDGHNVIAALGANPETVARGLDRLPGHLREGARGWGLCGRLFDLEPAPETPDCEQFLADALKRDCSSYNGRPGAALTALRHAKQTGCETWGRVFMELVTPYATGEIPLSFWLMSAVDFWTDALVVDWDRVEEFPWFTDEERLLLANLIVSCTEYCHDSITYQKWRITEEEYMVFNHHTFPARSLFFGCMYLRRHGYDVVDVDGWLAKSGNVFARAAAAGRSFDEGGAGYSWLVASHLLEVSFARGDTSYAASEKLARYADLATVIQNSHFELVPFGDCGSYHSGGGNAGTVLLQAAQWHRDPGLKWVAERCAPEAAERDLLTRDLPAIAPERHVGLFVLGLDPTIRRWAGLPCFPGYPDPLRTPNVPEKKCFDKLSLRGGWGRDDDYLLLQGFGAGQHGHPDANAISQYQVRGRLFLVDNDYIRRMPRQHNMVMVIRAGQHDTIPVTARLDLAVEFDGGALTQTSLLDYNGCDWVRTLVWLNGDCTLVIDELTARQPGQYELRCYWRTLGTVTATERGMRTEHDGEHFQVIELSESERRIDVEEMPLNGTDYPNYEYGDSRPRVLCEAQSLQLREGQGHCFVNLLLPTGNAPEARRSIRRDGQGSVCVEGVGPQVTVTPTSVRVGERWQRSLEGDTVISALAAPAPPPVSRSSSPTAPAVEAVWSASLPAQASCACRIPDGVLVGCIDGTVLSVREGADPQVLARTGDRIGAVLAGKLFGEADITYLVTGHDGTLRMLHPDGTARVTVDLPRNGHMPAWGRALCLADLDGDGKQWPVVGTAAWRIHAVSPDGALRWTFDTAAHAVTCLARGDLNGDGREEIVAGTVYFCVPAVTADGGRLWQDEDYNDFWRAGPLFPFIFTHDVDGDGELEVVTAASDTLVHCIDHLGEKRWTYSIGDDPAGLGMFEESIVAASRTGDVHCLDGHGRGRWRTPLGAPCLALTVADAWVCVSTEDGQVAWIDAEGVVIGIASLAAPADFLLAVGDGRVLATCADGAVICLSSPLVV